MEDRNGQVEDFNLLDALAVDPEKIEKLHKRLLRIRDNLGQESAQQVLLKLWDKHPDLIDRLADYLSEQGDTEIRAEVSALQQRYAKVLALESAARQENAPESVKREAIAAAADLMADAIEAEGLRLEDHLRICDQGMAITHAAIQALIDRNFSSTANELQGWDDLKDCGLDRNSPIGFTHPLAEFDIDAQIPGGGMNDWATVSIIVSGALGWAKANQPTCWAALQELVAIAAPTLDLKTLAFRSRFDDRALLQLCNLAQIGLEAKLSQGLGDDAL